MRIDLRRLRPDAPNGVRRLLLDAAPAVGLLALGLIDLFVASGAGFEGPKSANAAFLVAACLPLLIRRPHPVAALAAVFTVQAAWIDAYYSGPQQPPFEPFVAGIVVCFALGFHGGRRGLRIGVAAFAAIVAVGTAIAYATGDPSLGNGLPAVIWWLAAIGIGRGLHERQALVDLLRDRTARLESDRERDLAEAAMEERARIARELHDVIAHAVSVMVVQAGAERRMLDASQARTAEALVTIERSGREALGELRRLLGVLRARDRSEKLAPQPGLAGLPDLIADARGAGQMVDCRVEGGPLALPAGLDLTAYRIVQEALTNARKHAPGARTEVRLRWRPTELQIEVVDDGPGRSSRSNGTGHGLIGMRERAALYGGTLAAAPGRAGGFHVRAQLPIERNGTP